MLLQFGQSIASLSYKPHAQEGHSLLLEGLAFLDIHKE